MTILATPALFQRLGTLLRREHITMGHDLRCSTDSEAVRVFSQLSCDSSYVIQLCQRVSLRFALMRKLLAIGSWQ